MFGRCVCGHFRDRYSHDWDGRDYGPSRNCALCDKPFDDHVYVEHQFQRCSCNGFAQS